MTRSFRDILAVAKGGRTVGHAAARRKTWDDPVLSLSCDSRRAAEGSIFFCLVGKTVDGHTFAPSAYRNGCRVFVVQYPVDLPRDAVQFRVADTRAALADCAAEFYGHPEREMRLVGLTGTKGKTTTALLIRSLLEDAGIPAGYIGTNGVDYRDVHHQTVNSTPESLDIYRYLREMLDAGVATCVMEISSQALWMERTRGLAFDTVLFTNLSRDHIGGVEHPDFRHYRTQKRKLFTSYEARAAVVNLDDPYTPAMIKDVPTPILGFGTGEGCVFSAADIRPVRSDSGIGVEFTLIHNDIRLSTPCFLPLPGAFNVQNALAALTVVCERFGVEPRRAMDSLARAVVPGRFEAVSHPALPDVTFVIDYAHNGVSLASILDALRAYAPARLICLFGSVGGRTKERRAQLADAAAPRCDLCILTSDNPADEPPEDIIDEIDAAFPAGACPRVRIPDRADAIRYAVEIAEAGDIILLAGKGHENYQLIGVRREPFSEIDILKDALDTRAPLPVP